MKRFYIVVVDKENEKYFAHAHAIGMDENLLAIIKSFKYATIIHTCESATKAHYLAAEWNESYKANGTYLFD